MMGMRLQLNRRERSHRSLILLSCIILVWHMTRPRTLSGPLVGPTSVRTIVLRDELKQRCVIDSFIHKAKQIFVHFLVLYQGTVLLVWVDSVYSTTVEFNLLWFGCIFPNVHASNLKNSDHKFYFRIFGSVATPRALQLIRATSKERKNDKFNKNWKFRSESVLQID